MKHFSFPIFPTIITAIIAISVVAGLITVGSPSQERTRRFDDQRISRLQQIRFGAIASFYEDTKRLPDSLQAVQRTWAGDGSIFVDPETQEPFEYRVTGSDTYELCATFGLPMDADQARTQPSWSHEAGRTCFSATAQSQQDKNLVAPTAIPAEPTIK